MKVAISILLLVISVASTISTDSDRPDFFYLTLQWPASQCSTTQGCCHSESVKPLRDFVISGLQPYYFNGTFPEHCGSHVRFNVSEISQLIERLERNWPSLSCPAIKGERLWSREWQKYGTCSVFDEYQYFEAALRLKKKASILKILRNAGIQPNGRFYDPGQMSDAIVNAGLHLPGIVCNQDKQGNSQLSQVTLCSNSIGDSIVECPGQNLSRCDYAIVKFPSF